MHGQNHIKFEIQTFTDVFSRTSQSYLSRAKQI